MLFSFFNVEVKAMERKAESYIHGSFRNRLREGGWWEADNELLNMLDINERPSYYKGSYKEWIEELTIHIFLNPHEWDTIYNEYLQIVSGNSNTDLRFYRNEEGYLRLTETREIYLKIAGETEPISHTALISIGHALSEQGEELFYSYLEYIGMGSRDKRLWIERMKEDIEKNTAEQITVTFTDSLDESNFKGDELYFDPLNDLYIIL